MGKTERISSHCACLATSIFGGAGMFNVVIILFTVASSIRRGLPETARRPLFALLDTAKQSPPPPRDVLLQFVRASRGPQIPAASSTRKSRIPPCHTPPPCVPATYPARVLAASRAPQNVPPEGLERNGQAVPHIPVHPQ